jgi:sortase A
VRRALERGLLATGLACLAWYGFVSIEGVQARRAVERALAAPAPAAAAESAADDRGQALGLLEIARIGLSAPVLVGDDDATLRAAAGLLPDTARPWQDGNTAIAGHRDREFALLRYVRAGDRIRLATPRGDFEYEVASTRVVPPDDLSVLEDGRTASLTLITCHPFLYIGAAPDRFVVRATRLR